MGTNCENCGRPLEYGVCRRTDCPANNLLCANCGADLGGVDSPFTQSDSCCEKQDIRTHADILRHPADPSIIYDAGEVFGLYKAEAIMPRPPFIDEHGCGWADEAHTDPWCVAPGIRNLTPQEFLRRSPTELFE